MSLLESFKKNWHQQNFARPSDTVLLAVSGGSDSMVMADLFLRAGLNFAIANCNFQLRGEDANLDEDLVRNWCTSHNVPFYHIRFDTAERSAEWKKGIQETARILRYEWLESVRNTHKYACIATAHHANDNAETLLINLFRGTGISGLHGILPVNDKIIRPLLFASKEEILQYATENQIAFRDDSSNATDNYLRNEIRHNILPVAQQWFPNVIANINESIARFADAEVLYKAQLEIIKKRLIEKRGNDLYIPVLLLKKQPAFQTVMFEVLQPYGFTSAQLPQIIGLLDSQSGHYVVSSTHRVIRNRDFLVITALPQLNADLIVVDGAPSVIHTAYGSYHFSIKKRPAVIPADANVAVLDANRVEFPLLIRPWRMGDYFYPLGMGMKKKKLSRYFIDQKIPIHQKEQCQILECQKRIAWVAGMRLDERFKVTDNTSEVLIVEFRAAKNAAATVDR